MGSGEASKTIIRFTHLPDVSADGVSLVLSSHAASSFINLGKVDLDGGMVLGIDDAVGCRALAGHVQVNVFTSVVLHDGACSGYLSLSGLLLREGVWYLYVVRGL